MTEGDCLREFAALSREVARTPDPHQALATLVARTAALVGAEACALVLAGPEAGNEAARWVRPLEPVPAAAPHATQSSPQQGVEPPSETGALTAPLTIGERSVGFLALSLRRSELSPHDQYLLEALADRAALLVSMTEQSASMERHRFLDDLSRVLLESLDQSSMLQGVSRLLLPRLGEWCLVELVAEDGGSELAAVLHFDPERTRAASEHLRRIPVDPREAQGTWRVAGGGQTEVFPDVNPPARPPPGGQSSLPPRLRELGAQAYARVPLRVRQSALGTITFVRTEPERRYHAQELALCEAAASRIALALENTRRYRQVQESVRGRDDFVSVASHELRTPLASLLLYLQLFDRNLRAGDLSHPLLERLQRGINKAITQCQRLVELGERLLDVSQMNSGRFRLRLGEVDLAMVVRDVSSRLAESIAAAGCELHLQLEPSVTGRWDRVRLEQVVTNLVSNAVKYSPGKLIEVELRSDDESAALVVRDQGDGISAENLERIFGRFERGTSALRAGGWGLGLFVCRQIVEAHGGTIHVSSRPGSGASFIVRLPRNVTADVRQRRAGVSPGEESSPRPVESLPA